MIWKNGRTALSIACLTGAENLVTLLVENGANLETANWVFFSFSLLIIYHHL